MNEDNDVSSGEVSSLLELREQLEATRKGFLETSAYERSDDWVKEAATNQFERSLRAIGDNGGRFSPIADGRTLKFGNDLKAILNPADCGIAMLKAGGGWYKVSGYIAEGSKLLLGWSALTPIGAAAGLAIFVNDVTKDLLEWKADQEDEERAREYDLALFALSDEVRSLRKRFGTEVSRAQDIKAHARGGPGLRSQLVAHIVAAKFAQRSRDPRIQQSNLDQSLKHMQARNYLEYALQFIGDQRLLANTGERLSGICESQMQQWASDPERIGTIPKEVAYKEKMSWYATRSKLLHHYAKQFGEISKAFADAQVQLEGETYFVCLVAACAAAYSSPGLNAEGRRMPLMGKSR